MEDPIRAAIDSLAGKKLRGHVLADRRMILLDEPLPAALAGHGVLVTLTWTPQPKARSRKSSGTRAEAADSHACGTSVEAIPDTVRRAVPHTDANAPLF